jgi:hypothetical protein
MKDVPTGFGDSGNDVHTRRRTAGGHQVSTRRRVHLSVNDAGELVALRAYWELEGAAATARNI